MFEVSKISFFTFIQQGCIQFDQSDSNDIYNVTQDFSFK